MNFYGVNKINDYIPLFDMKNNDNFIDSLKIGGIIHKNIRKDIQNYITIDMNLLDLSNLIEKKTIEYCKNYNTINKGIGFPCGLSINDCAAHWTPSNNNKISLKKDDIIKIDYGIEINGWIIDSAFSFTFSDKHNTLIKAVKEATYNAIKNVGIDVNIREWANDIDEIMQSYNINVIGTLGGHNIKHEKIHGGFFLPCKDLGNLIPSNYRFCEGVYAIETFGSTGYNETFEKGDPTIFTINTNENINKIKLDTIKNFYNKLYKNFKTIPFCDRYIYNIDKKYASYINILLKNNLVIGYPPLYVKNNDNTAQFEHTIYINEFNKYNFSQGEDY